MKMQLALHDGNECLCIGSLSDELQKLLCLSFQHLYMCMLSPVAAALAAQKVGQ